MYANRGKENVANHAASAHLEDVAKVAIEGKEQSGIVRIYWPMKMTGLKLF